MSEMLEKCPCCKGEAEYCGYKFWWVQCKECELSTKTCETKEEATKLWNTRKPMQNIVERLAIISDEANDKIIVSEDSMYYDGYEDGVDKAIAVVKEEGGLNA